MSWVFDHSQSHLAARLVLLAIANHANAEGWNAFPSVAKIAREAHVSDRQVQRALIDLAASGELLVCFGGGPNGAHAYKVQMGGDNLSPGGVTFSTSRGDKSCSAIRNNRPEPSKPITPPTPLKKGGADLSVVPKNGHRRQRVEIQPGACAIHPDSGLTPWGTCWTCYSEQHRGDRVS